jgi:hypothetical protein
LLMSVVQSLPICRVLSVVPQRSVLGPVLFILLVTDITECMTENVSVKLIFRMRRVKFYFHILHEANRYLRDIFWTYLADHVSDDQDLASSVCERISVNCNAIYANFRLIST